MFPFMAQFAFPQQAQQQQQQNAGGTADQQQAGSSNFGANIPNFPAPPPGFPFMVSFKFVYKFSSTVLIGFGILNQSRLQ